MLNRHSRLFLCIRKLTTETQRLGGEVRANPIIAIYSSISLGGCLQGSLISDFREQFVLEKQEDIPFRPSAPAPMFTRCYILPHRLILLNQVSSALIQLLLLPQNRCGNLGLFASRHLQYTRRKRTRIHATLLRVSVPQW